MRPGGADDFGPYGPKVVVFEDDAPTLEHAQGVVGGYVELITLPDGAQMLVNEEGLLKQLPVNTRATFLAGRMIVGNALILRGGARWE